MSGDAPQRIHHLRPLREAQTEPGDRPPLTAHLNSTGPTSPPVHPERTADQSIPPDISFRDLGSNGSLDEESSYSPLTVKTVRDGRLCVITPTGELDMSSAGTLDAAVRAAEATDAKQITIDLTEVTFIDCSALRMLLRASARARADSNRLRLVRGSGRVQRVFELTNTEEILPFFN